MSELTHINTSRLGRSAVLLGWLGVVGLSPSCLGPRGVSYESAHTIAYGESASTAMEVACEADRYWHLVPSNLVDESVLKVDISFSADGANRTTLRKHLLRRDRMSVLVGESEWMSVLGHEIFHARTLSKLEDVPQIIQEGLAEYSGVPPGPLGKAKRAWAYATAAGQAIPDAGFWLESETLPRKLFIRFSSPIGFDSEEGYPLASTIPLNWEQIATLENFASITSYSNSFVAVEAVMGMQPPGEFPDFDRLPNESVASYMLRLGIGDQEWVRQLAAARLENYSRIDFYWGLMVPFISREMPRYPDAEAFLASTRANLQIGVEDILNLEEEPGYRELVELIYQINTPARSVCCTGV